MDKNDEKTSLDLMKKCKFTKEEYYSNNENKQISLLCELNDKDKLKKNSFSHIEKIITEIKRDLDGEISIKRLEEFLENEKKLVIKRLGLIKIIYPEYEPEYRYNELKKTIMKIKFDIKDLSFIQNSLSKFHSEIYKSKIREISEIIKDIQENNLNYYKAEKTQVKIEHLKEIMNTAKYIEKVKDFILFEVLYDAEYGINQERRFNMALKKLDVIKDLFNSNATAQDIYQKNKEIFSKIKEIISDNEYKALEFINQMIDYFEIRDKKELIYELTLLFRSKRYEMDIKSIIYFFDNLNFNKDKFNEIISDKYKKLSEMNLEDLKKSLRELKNNRIYNYENQNSYLRFFTCLYEKKEAIDFLLSKTNQNISALYDKIDPTNETITIENIQCTEECLRIFNRFKALNNNFEIFEYIKLLSEHDISKFENFSKNYSSILELITNNDSSFNIKGDIELKNYNEYKSKDFSNLELLSYGSYGEVYSASNSSNLINETEICLKKINLEKMRLNYEENNLTDYLKDLTNEIKILKLLSDNKNSVKFFGTYDEKNEKVIIMEKCDKNLLKFIKERGTGMEIEEIKNKFKELNQLFKLIQKEKIIHRDLKLENFLIKYTDNKTSEYIIKLSDYGLGKFKNQSNGLFSGLKGTPVTMAPEIILKKTETYENTVDIFSLGIILYQLSHNLKLPFGNIYLQYGNVYIENYEKDNLTIEFDKSIKSKEFKDLVTKMIKLNPKNRLKWDEYFEHPFFK